MWPRWSPSGCDRTSAESASGETGPLRCRRAEPAGPEAAGGQAQQIASQARELAEEGRQIRQEMDRLPDASDQISEGRRLAERKEQQAEQVEGLQQRIEELAADARAEQPDMSRRLQSASESVRRNRLPEAIRASRAATSPNAPREYVRQLEEQIVRGLEELEQQWHWDSLERIFIEERIYRLRCVEAWSMVIPWIGFPLAALLKRFEPTSKAKYVAFTTLQRPEEMPAQKSRLSTIQWPYREGLRLDEAMHPLTLMAVGLYGKVLPSQNGAPLRLVVPWKYGFKSIKSIVKIELTDKQPYTSWSAMAPEEYGFYANVNPKVDHPRWSQAQERRLPSGLLRPNIIPTQMFNGYADQVAGLYAGMDLRTYY